MAGHIALSKHDQLVLVVAGREEEGPSVAAVAVLKRTAGPGVVGVGGG